MLITIIILPAVDNILITCFEKLFDFDIPDV